jgi:hypothetical protein
VNGGGWGCIYSHQPLPSRCSILPTVDGPPSWSGRSAPVDQRLKTQRSAVTAISTVILHLMRRQMSDKASGERSGRAPWTVREDAIIHFSEPVTFGFFGSLPTGRSAPEAGRSVQGLRRSLLFLRTVRSTDLDFCIGSVRGSSWCCRRSAARARTVRRKGPDGPRLAYFSKKLLLSGIIYGIPDSRFSIVVDEPLAPVEHIIWSKLVSQVICVRQFNHQNHLGNRCKPNSLSVPLEAEVVQRRERGERRRERPY